jgi:flagellar biosynthesis/type III secretory pathway protein FliH
MYKYERFVLKDFPKNAVVNLGDHEVDYGQEEMIADVITQHLQTIVTSDEILDCENEQSERDLSLEEIEQIKLESYNNGFEQARLHYAEQIDNLRNDSNFTELLKQRLESVSPTIEFDKEIVKMLSQIISEVAKKLYLVLPVDFEGIVCSELLSRVWQFYKEGSVILTVHPDRYEFCLGLLGLENIDNKLKEKLTINTDDTISYNDCRVESLNTRLEYKQENIEAEIVKILEQIKSLSLK